LKHVEKFWREYSTAENQQAISNRNYTELPLIAALEDIRSLHNVGSIFRTADGAGVNHLILTGITGCPPRKQIAKTSLGAEDNITWEYRAGFLDVLPDLKKAGMQIIGLECTDQSRLLNEVIAEEKIQSPICLVVGNEVTGISQEVLANCDQVCHLPMRGTKASLNVSVAFGIAAYALADSICLEKSGNRGICIPSASL
jgi:tRNA G18 (ribose-2'-O)-methylase SpoU